MSSLSVWFVMYFVFTLRIFLNTQSVHAVHKLVDQCFENLIIDCVFNRGHKR